MEHFASLNPAAALPPLRVLLERDRSVIERTAVTLQRLALTLHLRLGLPIFLLALAPLETNLLSMSGTLRLQPTPAGFKIGLLLGQQRLGIVEITATIEKLRRLFREFLHPFFSHAQAFETP